MNFFNLKKLLTKILQNIRRLPNYYNLNGGNRNRPTSANISSDNSGSVIQFLSSEDMTEGKPAASGNILHFNWDNNDTWASQLFVGHGTSNIQHRTQRLDGSWSIWQDVYKPFSSIPENANLNSDTYKDTHMKWYCVSDARAATLQNCPTNEAFTLEIDFAHNPAYLNSSSQYILQTVKNRHGKVWVRVVRSQDSGQTWNYDDWTNNVTGLGTAATKGVANGLSVTTSGVSVLDAAQGKVLDDKKLNKSGNGTITGGSLTIDRSSNSNNGSTARIIATSDKGSVDLRAGGSAASNPALGVYDNTNSSWLIRHPISENKTYIDELSPSGAIGGSSVTWASAVSGINSKSCRLFKIGNIVFITFAISITDKQTFLPHEATICTLPSGYRPKSETSIQGVFMRNTSSGDFATQVTGTVTISSGGVIKQSMSTICNAIYFSGFYVV